MTRSHDIVSCFEQDSIICFYFDIYRNYKSHAHVSLAKMFQGHGEKWGKNMTFSNQNTFFDLKPCKQVKPCKNFQGESHPSPTPALAHFVLR